MFVAALCAVVVVLGNDCIIDPCPVMVRRDYELTVYDRVARFEISGSRWDFRSSAAIALVDADVDDIRLSEIENAEDGESLPSGGRLIMRLRAGETIEHDEIDEWGFVVVRLDSGTGRLTLRGTFEWDIDDCDDSRVRNPNVDEGFDRCGDGFLQVSDECDDENDEEGDGCADCHIEQGRCTDDAWTYWVCEGEPSWCSLNECQIGSSDPACDLLVDFELELITEGLISALDERGRIVSSPEGVDCSCLETAISYDCGSSCSMDLAPCATLSAEGTGRIEFQRWADGCPTEDEECTVMVGGGHIVGIFASDRSGIEREREYTAYPLDSPGLDLRHLDAVNGHIVAAGDIIGEFENPMAEEVPDDGGPQPFVMALDDQLDVQWIRELTLQESVFDITDIAVDGSGDAYLVGGLNGTLELDGGTIEVENAAYPELVPREIVIVRFSSAGEHLWSLYVALPERYDLVEAQIGVTDDGTLGLSAVVDYHFMGDEPSRDLIACRVSPDGEIDWLQRLRSDTELENEVYVDDWPSLAIDSEGSLFVAAAVWGEGPFEYEIPEAPEPGDLTLFVSRFSAEGVHLWSESFPFENLEQGAMEVDKAGQIVIYSISGIASYSEDGALGWTLENDPRPSLNTDYFDEPVRSFDVDPESGDLVVVSEVITFPRTAGSSDDFLATVTSRFTPDGLHLWTVRRESRVAGRRFLFSSVSVDGDDIIVLGTRYLPGEEHNDVAVVRHIVGEL